MLMMATMADHVSGVVEQCAGFQEHARLWWQAMYRLQLVKQLAAEFTHMLGMLLIVLQTPRKTARANKQLTRSGVVPMRFLPGKLIARNFLQQALAHANARNRKRA